MAHLYANQGVDRTTTLWHGRPALGVLRVPRLRIDLLLDEGVDGFNSLGAVHAVEDLVCDVSQDLILCLARRFTNQLHADGVVLLRDVAGEGVADELVHRVELMGLFGVGLLYSKPDPVDTVADNRFLGRVNEAVSHWVQHAVVFSNGHIRCSFSSK